MSAMFHRELLLTVRRCESDRPLEAMVLGVVHTDFLDEVLPVLPPEELKIARSVHVGAQDTTVP